MTFAILDPVGQQRFYMEAQPFEQSPRVFMVRHHLCGDLAQLENPGQRDDFRAERLAEPPRARC